MEEGQGLRLVSWCLALWWCVCAPPIRLHHHIWAGPSTHQHAHGTSWGQGHGKQSSRLGRAAGEECGAAGGATKRHPWTPMGDIPTCQSPDFWEERVTELEGPGPRRSKLPQADFWALFPTPKHPKQLTHSPPQPKRRLHWLTYPARRRLRRLSSCPGRGQGRRGLILPP